MFGKLLKPFRPGSTISARALNAPHRMLEQVSRLQGGRGVMWTPGGPFIQQPGLLFRLGNTYSTGIPARTSSTLGTDNQVADVWIEVSAPDTADLRSSTSKFRAFNMSSQPVQPLTYVICAYMWNLWIVIWEDCPASG